MPLFLLLSHCYLLILSIKLSQVKIVIVDSVTFHFRQDFEDLALRTRLLSGMALKLMNLARNYSLAVSNRKLVIMKFSFLLKFFFVNRRSSKKAPGPYLVYHAAILFQIIILVIVCVNFCPFTPGFCIQIHLASSFLIFPLRQVVIFNQVTTKYVEGSFQLALALG